MGIFLFYYRDDGLSLTSTPSSFLNPATGGMSNLASLLMDDSGGSLLGPRGLLGQGSSLLGSILPNTSSALSFMPPPQLPQPTSRQPTDSVVTSGEPGSISSFLSMKSNIAHCHGQRIICFVIGTKIFI